MLPDLYINGFACLKGDADAAQCAPYLDVRSLRRAEAVSKNALLCACQALAQARLTPQQRADMGISLAMGAGALSSTIKFMDSIVEDGDELSSPTAFANSVHNSTSFLLSSLLKITGPCLVTGQMDASFAGALLTAQQLLAQNMCPQVLVTLAEDVNPLLAQVLQKEPHRFDPYVYQPQLPPVRVAGALVVSAAPTDTTRAVLKNITLARTDDTAAHTQPQLAVQSCAHSLLLLADYLQTPQTFDLREQFAGMIFALRGEPYVHP